MPKTGVVAAAGLVAVVLVHPAPRVRAGAMLGALVLAPVLLLAAIWHSPQLHVIHRHPLEAAVAALVVLAAVALLAFLIWRRPWVLAPLVVFTLPFRVPISAGGATSNLLVPLYLVVGAASLAYIVATLGNRKPRGESSGDGVVKPEPTPGWVERLLALYVVLYALQAIYSPSFEKALQQMVFFYVPFALLFCLLRQLRWTPTLLRRCLVVLVSLALVFCVIGFVEYATKTLLLNPKLIAEDNVHTYFAINSVFFDPDIFGRFLALVMIIVATVLVYTRRQQLQLASVGVLAVLWAGLVLTLSRSSLAALLVGLGVIGAMRWRARPVLLGAVAVVIIGIAALAISPKTFGLNQGLNGASSGRAGLVSGGLKLFSHRPLWGYGSGSFEKEYLCHVQHQCGPASTASNTLSASHTIAITVAAEQGLIGELPYLALVVVSVVVLFRGARRDPVRVALAAAFLALVFHTELYADFLEDPLTWTLLGIGTALAYAARPRAQPVGTRSEEVAALA
ncbi:MAG: O-antigen ligase family protein [Solirubrobacterales bacterium]|nr:O-antigen ligase family protein [Solirubrobacterales bacterium]